MLTQQILIKVWLSFSLDSIIYSLKAMNPPLLLFSCELKYQYNLCWVLMQKNLLRKNNSFGRWVWLLRFSILETEERLSITGFRTTRWVPVSKWKMFIFICFFLGLGRQFLTFELRCLWGSNDLVTGAEYQISCISDIYITMHNSSKIIFMK